MCFHRKLLLTVISLFDLHSSKYKINIYMCLCVKEASSNDLCLYLLIILFTTFLKCKQEMQSTAISSAWYNSEYVNIYGCQPWLNTEMVPHGLIYQDN